MPSPRGGILLRADRGAFRALPACAARAAAAWLCAMAKLYFNYSTMNAGKSTLLLQAAHNYGERGMEVYLLTARLDTRAGAGRILGGRIDGVLEVDDDGIGRACCGLGKALRTIAGHEKRRDGDEHQRITKGFEALVSVAIQTDFVCRNSLTDSSPLSRPMPDRL